MTFSPFRSFAFLTTLALAGNARLAAQNRAEARVHDYSTNTYSCFLATTTPNVALSCPPSAVANGVGTASAMLNYGAISASAFMSSAGSHGFSDAVARVEDVFTFGAGPIPTDVFFLISASWSVTGTNQNPGPSYDPSGYANIQTGIGSGSQYVNWSQDLDFPNAGLNPLTQYRSETNTFSFPTLPGGFVSLPTGGSATFLFTFAAVVYAYFNLGSGSYTVSNSSSIDAIRFYADGVDITDQVTATSRSGHDYGFDAPVTTPEPGALALMATGLLALSLVRRGQKQVAFNPVT